MCLNAFSYLFTASAEEIRSSGIFSNCLTAAARQRFDVDWSSRKLSISMQTRSTMDCRDGRQLISPNLESRKRALFPLLSGG
jgi:hypothetical protein